ncbi:MAG TPA: acylphosphatase [Egibacteraceae bacterium]|nr:acylphosphatase [Egibacteraceae bacterium]
MQVKRVQVVAAGLVQGVFFRAALRDEAQRLGVTGWVRNRSDGRVEAELQGPAQAVEDAIEFVRRGPGKAEIAEMEVRPLSVAAREGGFRTLPDA